MTHRLTRTLAILAVTIAAAAVGAQTMPATTQSDFQVKTTGDLVRLCEAKPADTTGIAALHFCEGFAVGAYQYYQIVIMAEAKRPLVCPPTPPPTRDEAIASFLRWARQNPQAMSTPPAEGLFESLAQRYPCRA